MKKSVTAVFVAFFLLALVLPTSAWAQEEQVNTASTVGVQYKTHIQDKGWETAWKSNGVLSGTVGEWKRLEALVVKLTGTVPAGANIETYVHVQNQGNLGPFAMGSEAGTDGLGLRMERIKLVLNNLPGYRLKYDVQVQNKGWLRDQNDDTTWFVSGENAGTTGEGLRLEGIKIKLVKVNEAYEAYKVVLGAVEESDYTTSSWADYELVVAENTVSEYDSTADINAAAAALKAAQKMLVLGKNLTAYNQALAAVKEAEFTPETWAVYQQIVDENKVSQADTQIDINTATANIVKAQKNLQWKLDLTDYNEALAGVRSADYTVDSWSLYQKVAAAYAMTENNTQTDVDTATKKIIEAQKKMVRKFDFTAYNALLDAVKEEDYTTVSWAIYKKVVDKNVVTENDTQTDIEKAIKLIEEAQKKLVRAADLSAYEAVRELVDRDSCTTTSWAVYQKVLEANVVTKNNTQAEIDAAIDKIMKAQLKLVGLGDMTEYDNAVAAAVEANYTTKSWETYQKIVDANTVTAASGQTAIDAATTKIITAQQKLVKCGILTEYNNAIVAESANEAIYTSKSWAIYMKVVDANEMDRDKSQSQINTAVLKIQSAQKKLILKGDTTAYFVVLGKVKEEENTVASWTIYKKILGANYMSSDNSQVEINAAIVKIEAAQLNLVKIGNIVAYNVLVEKYYGKQDLYTTTSWAAYQKILADNVMTTENTDAQIAIAISRIKAAEQLLKDAAIMTFYNDSRSKYDGKDSEYTVASWAAYQAELLKNLVTKDNTQKEVDTATTNIDNAQKNLVRSTNLTAFKATFDLYQENLKNKGATKILATEASWLAYATKVEKYANFDATTGDWLATGSIVETTTQVAVDAATEAIQPFKDALIPSGPALAASFVDYDKAIKLDAGHTADQYTVGSYALYINECEAYQFPVRIKASVGLVQLAVTQINGKKVALEEHATNTTLFDAEWKAYEAELPNKDRYITGSWNSYVVVYNLYYGDPRTRYTPEYKTQAEYDAATAELKAAREALVVVDAFKAQTISITITATALQTSGVHNKTNLLALAKGLVTTSGYTVTLANPIANPNVGVDTLGVVTGAAGSLVNISFTVTQDAKPANTYTVTITGLSVS